GGAAYQREQHLRRPVAELLIGPLHFPRGKRREKVERFANAAPVGGLIIPELDAERFAKFGKLHQAVEIADAVTPGFRPRELEWLAAVGFDLHCDAFRLRSFEHRLREFLVAEE